MPSGIHALIPPPGSGDGTEEPGADPAVDVQQVATVEGRHRSIPVDAIRPNGYQPRTVFDDEQLQSLTESVRALGVLQPVLVRQVDGNTYELIAGERRWRAACNAGLVDIPAIVRDVDEERSLAEAVVENVQRQDLNAIDEAFAYQQLMEDFRLSQAEIAQRVGKSRATIANTIRLLQLPGSLRQMVSDGELSAGHGRALLMLDDNDERMRVAQECSDAGWSVRQLEAFVRDHEHSSVRRNGPKPTSGPRQRTADPTSGSRRGSGVGSAAALEVESQLSDFFNTSVEVVEKSGNGRLVIEFADEDDLARIVELIGPPGRT